MFVLYKIMWRNRVGADTLNFHHLKSSKKLNWSISKPVSIKNMTAKSELFRVQNTEVNSSISQVLSPPEDMQVFIADHYKHVFVGNA